MATSWLIETQRQLGNLGKAEFLEPSVGASSNEHVVGRASPELQKLYSLATARKKKAMELSLETKFSSDRSSQEQNAAKVAKLAAEAKVLMNVMWIALKDQFGLWDKESVGLRKNWQVVWFEDRPQLPFVGLLSGLFGRFRKRRVTPTWLEQAQRQLNNLVEAEFLEPQSEADDDDHVVGTASEELHKLYSLAMSFEKKGMEVSVELQFSSGRSSQEKTVAKAVRLAANAKVLLDIFWIAVKDEFSLWDKSSIGIRKGWQVVWSKEPDVPPIIGFLGDLFGGR